MMSASEVWRRRLEIEELQANYQQVLREVNEQSVMLLDRADEIERLRTWIENVATDEQLDAPVSALGGQTGRQLLGAFNKGVKP